ncbi:MAG: outer membrane beta-barrel protein [Bacteroidales bacterium]|nr:outer membrane beta-barrel protein [Bacteroidales bacterium]
MIYKRLKMLLAFVLISAGSIYAQQGSVKLRLVDSLTQAPVDFASVYVSKDGTVKGAKHSMTDEHGYATIEKVAAGHYIFKAELMGYKVKQMNIEVGKGPLDLGEIKMQQDVNTLEQVVVSAVGNPIVVKKDTIEYSATSIKTSDNDMLEDLIKKLPGFEVDSDGNITANGETVKKVYIDGKEFFLDDPQLASKNIPAKIINKVKLVEKKSEQAEFTGIDDGEEETVLDLSIRPGMMKGWFGNLSGGGGMDIANKDHDARFQGAAMIGRFTDKSQISIIGNGNNTNNRGFQDMAGEMMGAMRGGGMRGMGGMGWGGNSGITTSWMGGVNANGHLLDGDLELGGNYLYSGNEKVLEEKTNKMTMLDDNESINTRDEAYNITSAQNHRAGVRADWDITDKTSILFTPSFNFGYADFEEKSTYSTDNNLKGKVNDGVSLSTGNNDNWRANGRLLLRQKIGKTKGRTLSLNVNYNVSQNGMTGNNYSETNSYENGKNHSSVVDQMYLQRSDAYTVGGRFSYTEPLGKNFFLEASYRYNYRVTDAEKMTYDKDMNGNYASLDTLYSSKYRNTFIDQDARINLVKQEEKYNFQVGFSVQPAYTKSVTTLLRENRDSVLAYSVVNYAPSARFDYRFSDRNFLRINYRGSTNQPSITQLQPVPDNSNPLRITLGNPKLQPEFSHRFNINYRNTNTETFASQNANLYATYVKDDIINASWYNSSGVQFTAPINSKEGTFTAGGRYMFNTPIAKSNFSFMTFTNVSVSRGLSYTGSGDVETLDEIIDDLVAGKTTTLNVSERINFVYRNDSFEARLGGSARFQNAWYTIKEQERPSTWTNSINGEVNYTMPWGTEIKTDARYTFYIGYEDGYNEPTCVWNAEISQLLFKKKATLRFKVYDILQQAKNVYRTTTDNYVQDVEQNTLGQYFMLSFTFRFGNFGGQRMGGPGGPGRGPGMGRPPMGPRR